MKSQQQKSEVPLEVVSSARFEPRAAQPLPANVLEDDEPTLRSYLETILDARWFIVSAMVSALVGGALYLLFATPIYQSDVLVQVEDKKPTLSGLEDLANMFTSQSPADTEIEILRSRMLVGSVVDELRLDVIAEPRFFPIIGRGIARRYEADTPAPPVLRLPSFAWGGERIEVSRLDVPRRWEGEQLTLVARGGGRYDLLDPEGNLIEHGEKGKVLASGQVGLLVSELVAREGTRFRLERRPRVKVIETLQKALVIAERGKKTGVIRVALDDPDADRVVAILDAIARTYVRQNVERKSAEAEKTLVFITSQLPQLKANAEKAEAALNEYRKQRGGGFDLSVETQAALDRAADIERLLTEIELQRNELRTRFTESHPAFLALRRKAAQLQREREELNSQLKRLPETELNAARLTRDVKVANELYVLLLNKSQELEVMKSGTIGNVRIVDHAQLPVEPEWPKPLATLGLSAMLGLMLGIGIAFVRKALDQAVEDPDVIEKETGLPVYAAVPHSSTQARATQSPRGAAKGLPVLALAQPNDLAVEALRSLRTSLQFALADASNNLIAISGPSPSIGKSFVSVNLAHVMADLGKRVLLVDADLRKGRLHHYFGGLKAPGLSDLVLGTANVRSAVQKTSHENLEFLGMGERPPNPSELLSSARFKDVMGALSHDYDLVIVDTAPVLAVTDATIACGVAGTNLIVLKAAQHPIREVVLTVRTMTQNGVSPRAIILNNVMPKAGGYLYSKYKYHYHYKYE